MTLSWRISLCAGALAASFVPVLQPAAAQAVVQALPPPSLADLNAALKTLAREPRNVPALLRAAWASIGLDDTEAALGFFRRAQAADPANAEVKAGMATVELRQGDPVAALRLFDEAERGGVPMARFAADRGLAHDLVGDNASAQRFYREALANRDDAEVTRRLAISQAIAGDQRTSEATLLPLLQHSDLAAYRSRAFALAILGKSEEAVSIAQTMLPGSLSNRMAPYLRYMPRLTRAQQAAAANLGRFPPADQIGRDSPAIAALSQQAAPPVQVAVNSPDARLAPAGQPLGSAPRGARSADVAARPVARQPAAAQAQAGPAPARTGRSRSADASRRAPVREHVVPASEALVRPDPAEAKPQDAQPAQQQPAAAVAQIPAAPVVVASASPEPQRAVTVAALPPSDAPRPAFSITRPAEAVPASPDESPVEAAPDVQTLADAFADFAAPPASAPARGGVDLSKIEVKREQPPAKEEAKAEKPKAEKPKPPANPSRVWVQVATGRDTKALAFDWRRITREAGPLLAKREPFIARWGQANRLVTGPYASQAEAQKAVAELKKKGLDSFTFISDEGEAVNPLK